MTTAYYNEFNPKAAAWLRELMADGLIPKGTVDERSIIDVRPEDLAGYTQCHFFAGIGGWPLALQLAGWPEDRPVWTGSCPCQPFSCAGKQLGQKDERHLWPAFFRLICECRPDTVIGEQVEGAVGKGWLDGVCGDLEGEGYACGAVVLGAHSVGAPHIRQRLFWVADATECGINRRCDNKAPERVSQISEPYEFCNARGLAESDSERLGKQPEQHCKPEEDTTDRDSCGRHADGCSGQILHSRVADDQGRGQRADGGAPGSAGYAEQCEQTGGVVNSIITRLEGHTGDGNDRHQPGRNGENPAGSIAETSESGFCSDYSWHPCKDGKLRRIPLDAERLFQRMVNELPEGLDDVRLASYGYPLAPKIQGRAGLLKGYGNAINPHVAAAFIKAYLETKQ